MFGLQNKTKNNKHLDKSNMDAKCYQTETMISAEIYCRDLRNTNKYYPTRSFCICNQSYTPADNKNR